jgi:predicted metalloprotease with PDZ domain
MLTLVWSPAIADEYKVTIESSNQRLARVEATVTPTASGELLLLRDAGDSGIEGGWARFLQGLEVRDAAGEPVSVETVGEGRYLVGGAGGPLGVRYSMRLEHDQVENLPGADELAWAGVDAVLWSGRALFVEGAPARNIAVSYALPEGWRATTPWQVIEPGRRFVVEDTDALLDSAFIVGKHFEAKLGEGDDAAVRIALAGPNAVSQKELIVETVERYLDVFGRLHGGPSEGRLLLVAADGAFWGGGVMGTTISMLLGGALDETTLPMLRFITVHEVFHLWNANFHYGGPDEQESLYWMSEGTANYYTARSQLGAGDVSEEAVLGQLADEVRKYRAALGKLSMVAGGRTKLSNYDLIYSGGFMASLALDVAIRVRSEDRHSLDDVMRSLHSGPGRRVDLDVATLGDVILSTTGVSVDDLLTCCIEGAAELPLVELLADLGLALTGEGDSVGVQPAAGAQAAERWAAWPLR